MIENTEIFVRLLDEAVDVWRPVRARHLHDDIFLINEQPYDRSVERWQFEPGDWVVCECVDRGEGEFLEAVGLSPPTEAGA